ncbi:MAG: hypothetical protein J6Y58_05515 [Clostridiales bacterium]|nr:hypothetical protein [Clostridiales bacterium]
MKNEFLMDSFGYISDEYIAEAASFQKRSRSVTWIPYAGIAAAFLSIIGIFFLVKSTVRREKTAPSEGTDTYLPETGLEETVPATSGTEATVAMTRPAVDEGKVLFAPDKSAGECHDEMVGAHQGVGRAGRGRKLWKFCRLEVRGKIHPGEIYRRAVIL